MPLNRLLIKTGQILYVMETRSNSFETQPVFYREGIKNKFKILTLLKTDNKFQQILANNFRNYKVDTNRVTARCM